MLQSTRKHNTQDNQDVNPFTVGDHKAAMHRQDNITEIQMQHK